MLTRNARPVMTNPIVAMSAPLSLIRSRLRWPYAAFFPLARNFAHRARCAAAIFLRADADIVRLGFTLPTGFLAALFAHRAFCARLIRLRAEADRVRPGLV